MKSDADAIRSFLLGLLEQFSRTDSSPSGKVDELDGISPQVDSDSEAMTAAYEQADQAPYRSSSESSSTFSRDASVEMPPVSELGELPAVQDHFQTILKRRLQVEISQKPPLFPWESGMADYPVDLAATTAQPWMAELRSLALPTSLPDDILTGLLNRCQELLTDSLQPGVQLIKAVENLFPDQPQAMDRIAGLVLANATVRSTATRDVEALKAAFPDGYEGANPQQQVTLTMLAAKDIFDTLMLTLTPDRPTAQREWQTDAGQLVVAARYQAGTPNQISLTVEVPEAGQLNMPSLGQTVTQTRPGALQLTLPEPQANVVYPLEVYLSGTDSAPLTFALRWLDTE